MIRTGLIVPLLATCAIIPLAQADARLLLVGEPSEGMPACEEFYDKWEVAGAPSAMMAMFGLGREVFAAKSCLDKGDVATACKHWQGLLVVMDKMGPPLDESRGDVEQLMSEHKCETAAATGAASPPENAPASESAPVSEPAPDARANAPPAATGAPAESPAAEQ